MDANPLANNVVKTALSAGQRVCATFEQLVQEKETDKSKMVLPDLDLDTSTKMVVGRATHQSWLTK